ncbi:MAG: type II toxin-antitoxin system RelE/ParE family toxin [Nitrospinae bacterium]|nr:type II toxin-antitoxin system RelE/ParE family toxin [Nitrospinota bacterium]
MRRSLTSDQIKAAERYIDLLEEYGTRLRKPHSLKVKGYDNLFELRPKDVRLFYCFRAGGNAVIVLTAIKREKKLRPEVYAKAAEIKNSIEILGDISWNRLRPLN